MAQRERNINSNTIQTTFQFMITRILLAVFTLMAFTSSLSAQGRQSTDLECTAVAMQTLEIEPLFFRVGKEYQEFTYKTSKRGPTFYLPASSEEFELYEQVKPEEGGEVLYQIVGQCLVPKGTKRVLFLVANSSRKSVEASRILMRGLSDSFNDFPPGSMRFGNFTSEDLLVKIGDKISELKGRAFTVVRLNAPKEGGYIPVAYGDSNGNTLHFTKLYSQPRARKMVIITKPSNERRPLDFAFISQNISE